MQVIMSFVITLGSLFLILLVIVSQLNLFVNFFNVNRKRPYERFVNNKNSRQHDFTKLFSAANISMMSIYFYELVLFFFVFHNFCNNKGYVRCSNFSTNKFLTSNSFIYREFNSVAIFNIPHKNVLSSSYHFYHFSYSFKYSFFINSVFYNIFNVNSVTDIFNNDFYITYLFDRDNRFLFCNYKVTGQSINISSKKK